MELQWGRRCYMKSFLVHVSTAWPRLPLYWPQPASARRFGWARDGMNEEGTVCRVMTSLNTIQWQFLIPDLTCKRDMRCQSQ